MLKVKYENHRKKETIINEFKAFRRFNSMIIGMNWLLTFTAFCLMFIPGLKTVIPISVLFFEFAINMMRLPELVIDQISDCPCKVRDFRREYKKLRQENEMIETFEELKEVLPYHSEVKLKKKGRRLSVFYRKKLPVTVPLPGKWKKTARKKQDAVIDFDLREIRPV